MSEREAARMLERMRATEEDEEFERAFRSMVRSTSVRAMRVSPIAPQCVAALNFLNLRHPHFPPSSLSPQVHESVQGVRTVGTFKSAGTDRMAIPGEILMRRLSTHAVQSQRVRCSKSKIP
jgi:hypothetical protein